MPSDPRRASREPFLQRLTNEAEGRHDQIEQRTHDQRVHNAMHQQPEPEPQPTQRNQHSRYCQRSQSEDSGNCDEQADWYWGAAQPWREPYQGKDEGEEEPERARRGLGFDLIVKRGEGIPPLAC